MSKKLYLIILLLCPLFSIAQSNYRSGYVVNLKGDTLRGFINIKEWGHNPTDISFKPSMNDRARQMGLSEINYFEISGYVSYRQYRVGISLNPVDLTLPSSSADTTTRTDNFFLKILQRGKYVTLYAYRDNIKERFYIQDNSQDVPIELIYGIYQDPNSSDKVMSRNTYQIQLIQMALKYNPGDDKLITRIQQSTCQEGNMAAIVAQINGDAPAQASLNSAHNSPALRLFAGVGFISNTIKDGQYYVSPTATSGTVKIGAGVDVVVNPAVGHLIFRAELAYSPNSYTFNNIANPIDNNANPEATSITVKQNVISVTPQVIYNIYNGQGLKVFVDLGYSLNILSYPPNQISKSGGSGNTTPSSDIAFDSKGSYSTFQLKAGVVIAKRFEIYGSYFPKSDLSDSFEYTNDITSYQFGLSYYFGKSAR